MEIRLATTKFGRRSLNKILEDSEETSTGLSGLQEFAETAARFPPAIPNNDLDSASVHKTIDSMNKRFSTVRVPTAPLKLSKAISKLRRVEGIFAIGEETKRLPWTAGASSDVTLADVNEYDAESSYLSFDHFKQHLHTDAEQTFHDLDRNLQRDAQLGTRLEISHAANYPLAASWTTEGSANHLDRAISTSDAERSSVSLSSYTKRISLDSLKKRLRNLDMRNSVASSSLSLIHSVMNASILDSPRSSLQLSHHSDTARIGNQSRYRRPVLRPLLRIINAFSDSGTCSLPARQDPDLWTSLVENRQLDDAAIFLSPLTSSRECCSVLYLKSAGVPQCPRCGLTLHHYWARESFPFFQRFYSASIDDNKIDLHARDFFDNTPLHYLAASEIDIGSKLEAFLQPSAPISAINYLGQTFLHLLNPKSLRQSLRQLPEILQTFATCSFPFKVRDHNGETFLQTLLQHREIDDVDYETIRKIFGITKFSAYSGNTGIKSRLYHITLHKLLSSTEISDLYNEFTLDKKGPYHFFDNESVYDFRQLVEKPSKFMMWRVQSYVRSEETLPPCNQSHEQSQTLQLAENSANPYELVLGFVRHLANEMDVNWIDTNGNTLLGTFAGAWQDDKQYSKEDRDMLVQELVRKGANCNLSNSAGNTPLFIAIQAGQDTVVEIILQEASVRPQRYTCARLVSTAHSTMRQAQKVKNDELYVASMRIIALLGAEIVESSKSGRFSARTFRKP